MQATAEVTGETIWKIDGPQGKQSLRLVWAHDPDVAAEQGRRRQQAIDDLIAQAQARAGKLTREHYEHLNQYFRTYWPRAVADKIQGR